jgi:NTP pyrophosphatase (non-canonical NTP hydrolase)
MNINLLYKIQKQTEKCYLKYGKYASFHEAMSVCREEFEELWEECKRKELDFEKIENEIIDCLVVLFKMHQDIVVKENRR